MMATTGATGLTGPTGMTGPMGATGFQGPTGPTGECECDLCAPYLYTASSTSGATGASGVVEKRNPTTHEVLFDFSTNNIRGMASDPTRSLLFIARGTAGMDFRSARTGALIEHFSSTADRIAVNPNSNTLYALDGVGGQIWVFSESPPARLTSIATGGSGELAVDPCNNWIFLATSLGLVKIDGATNTIDSATPTSPGYNAGLALDLGRGWAYVLSSNDDIVVVDTRTNAPIDRAPLPSLTGTPISIAYNPAADRVYVGYQEEDQILVLDGDTLAQAEIVGVSVPPRHMTVDARNNLLYFGNYDRLSVLSGATNAILPDVPTPQPYLSAVAVDQCPACALAGATGPTGPQGIQGPTGPQGPPGECNCGVSCVSYAYVATADGVFAMDPETHAFARSYDIEDAQKAIANPARGELYVARGALGVDVLRLSTGEVTGHMAGGADDILFNPANNKLYLFDETSFEVHIYDAAASNPLDTILYPQAPRNPMLDTADNTVYLSADGYFYKIGGETDADAGSFSAQISYAVRGAAIDPVLRLIYFTGENDFMFHRYDITNSVVTSASIGDASIGGEVAADPKTGLAYLQMIGAGTVAVWDGAAFVHIHDLNAPDSIFAIDPAHGLLYSVGAFFTNLVTVTDTAANQTLAAEETPSGAAVHSITVTPCEERGAGPTGPTAMIVYPQPRNKSLFLHPSRFIPESEHDGDFFILMHINCLDKFHQHQAVKRLQVFALQEFFENVRRRAALFQRALFLCQPRNPIFGNGGLRSEFGLHAQVLLLVDVTGLPVHRALEELRPEERAAQTFVPQAGKGLHEQRHTRRIGDHRQLQPYDVVVAGSRTSGGGKVKIFR